MNTETKFKVTNISGSDRKVFVNGRYIYLKNKESFTTDYPPKDKDVWKIEKKTKEKIPLEIVSEKE